MIMKKWIRSILVVSMTGVAFAADKTASAPESVPRISPRLFQGKVSQKQIADRQTRKGGKERGQSGNVEQGRERSEQGRERSERGRERSKRGQERGERGQERENRVGPRI